MLAQPVFQSVGVAGVVRAVGTAEYVDPKRHAGAEYIIPGIAHYPLRRLSVRPEPVLSPSKGEIEG